jgi:DNA-binding MarR family transcriptional regulator
MDNTQQSPLATAYFRFLQLARAVDTLPEGSELDANELALLESVVLHWHEGNPMTVRQAIGLSTLGSPATLHKRITRLRQKGLLENHSEPGDRRAKFLLPTPQALEYFHRLGQTMQQVSAAG